MEKDFMKMIYSNIFELEFCQFKFPNIWLNMFTKF